MVGTTQKIGADFASSAWPLAPLAPLGASASAWGTASGASWEQGFHGYFSRRFMGFISLGIYLKFFGIYLKFFGIYLKFLVIYLKFMGIYLKFFGIYLKFFGVGHLLGFVWSLWLGSKKSSWILQKINYCNWTTCCFFW